MASAMMPWESETYFSVWPLPRTTERPARECGDEPRTISAQTPNTIVRGECPNCSQRAAPQSRTTLPEGEQRKAVRGNYVVRDQSHGRKSVVRGLPDGLANAFGKFLGAQK